MFCAGPMRRGPLLNMSCNIYCAAKAKRKNHPFAEATVAKGAENFYTGSIGSYSTP
jgi:hypothetical protein